MLNFGQSAYERSDKYYSILIFFLFYYIVFINYIVFITRMTGWGSMKRHIGAV